MQILVEVANTQARPLGAEVGKGFALTAIVRELVDPESQRKRVHVAGGAGQAGGG